MATDAEKQIFLDTVAGPHLAKFYEAALSRREFVKQYKEILGENGLAPAENRGLPEGETPLPIDETEISIMGFTVTGEQLYTAFMLEEAEDAFIKDSDIEFIFNMLFGSQ